MLIEMIMLREITCLIKAMALATSSILGVGIAKVKLLLSMTLIGFDYGWLLVGLVDVCNDACNDACNDVGND